MGRDLFIGNPLTLDELGIDDSLILGFDPFYSLKEIHYPYPGHSLVHPGENWEMALRVDGNYHPIHSPNFIRKMKYQRYSLVTKVGMELKNSNLWVHCQDLVSYQRPIYFRFMEIKNSGPNLRTIRIYFQQSPTFYHWDHAHASIDETNHAIKIHSPGIHIMAAMAMGNTFTMKNVAMAAGANCHQEIQNQFKTDSLNEVKSVSGPKISTGMSVDINLAPGKTRKIWFFLLFSQSEIENWTHFNALKKYPFAIRLKRTQQYWKEWTKVYLNPLRKSLPRSIGMLYCRSLLTLRLHSGSGGAMVSGLNSEFSRKYSPSASYCWPHEGSILARAWQVARYREISFSYFKFWQRKLPFRQFVPFQRRYIANGQVAPESLPFEWVNQPGLHIPPVGSILWCLWQHLRSFRDIRLRMRNLFYEMVLPGASFLSHQVDDNGLLPPGLDNHESRFGYHLSNQALAFAGLNAAVQFCKLFHIEELTHSFKEKMLLIQEGTLKNFWHPDFNRFVRMREVFKNGKLNPAFTNNCLKMDNSAFYAYFFGLFPDSDPKLESTLDILFKVLKFEKGVSGYIAYETEEVGEQPIYSLPGKTSITTALWAAIWQIKKAKTLMDLQEVKNIFNWVTKRAMQSRLLGEEFDPITGITLGLSPDPRTHAWFIIATRIYYKALKKFRL